MVPDYVFLGACFEIKNCALVHTVAIQLRLNSTSKKNTCALLARNTPPAVLADGAASAILARTAHPPMLTDAGPSTLLAHTALPPVLTDAAASAFFALTAYPPVLADAAPPTLLTLTAHPPMLTDARPTTLLAPMVLPPVIAFGTLLRWLPRRPTCSLSLHFGKLISDRCIRSRQTAVIVWRSGFMGCSQ